MSKKGKRNRKKSGLIFNSGFTDDKSWELKSAHKYTEKDFPSDVDFTGYGWSEIFIGQQFGITFPITYQNNKGYYPAVGFLERIVISLN